MERFLDGKEKGQEIWRFGTNGPHVPIREMVKDVVATLMGQDELLLVPLTTSYLEKIHVDLIAFSKMVFSVPPSFFSIKL